VFIDPDQQPVLIFDTNGKVRCSCVVGCIRKYSGWSLSSIFQEFEQFAEPEGGVADMLFIENHGEPNA
jgi:tyrosine-protein phosphatase SIW14